MAQVEEKTIRRHVRCTSGAEQPDALFDVILVIERGLRSLTLRRKRKPQSECTHRCRALRINACHQLAIADVAFIKRHFGRDRVAMPARQVIENNDLLAARAQQLGGDTADVTAPPLRLYYKMLTMQGRPGAFSSLLRPNVAPSQCAETPRSR